jgi:hypothetical protein
MTEKNAINYAALREGSQENCPGSTKETTFRRKAVSSSSTDLPLK